MSNEYNANQEYFQEQKDRGFQPMTKRPVENSKPFPIKMFVFLFAISFTIIPLIMIVAYTVQVNHYYTEVDKCVKVTAYIDGITRHYNQEDVDYDVYWVYTYEGKEYTHVSGNYNSSMREGDKTTFSIYPENPDEVLNEPQPVMLVIAIIFLIIGLAFSAIWVALIVKSKRKNQKKKA